MKYTGDIIKLFLGAAACAAMSLLIGWPGVGHPNNPVWVGQVGSTLLGSLGGIMLVGAIAHIGMNRAGN